MRLTTQRRIAAALLKCGVHRVWFDKNRLLEIKESITKADIRKLINDLAIQKRPENAISGFRRRKRLIQLRKGRQAGPGSRKGKKTARLTPKKAWMLKVRIQRKFLRELRDKKIITPGTYKTLYRRSKGGFFRSRRHVKLYIEEHNLVHHEKKTSTKASVTKKTAE